MAELTLAQIVEARQEFQAKLDKLDAQYKADKAPLQSALKMLEAAIQKMLLEQGLNSVKTPHGTAYRQQWRQVRIHDWEATLAWLRENERWDMLTHALNKTAVLEEVDADRTVPGLSVESGWKLNVRKS